MQRVVSRQEHDDLVQHIALQLLANGFHVQARVEGWFNEPDYIFEYRPDIVAEKGKRYLIVEVQKAETDWAKIAALQRFEQERGCEVRVVSPDDNWSELLHLTSGT